MSYTEITLPLPDVPASKLANTAAVAAISSHAYLFMIVMPIKTNRFETLLESHPNRLLVESICRGLRQGFWPYANIDGNTPTMWDNSSQPLSGNSLRFALQQRDLEITADRFSPPFGPDLLPRMYSMPIGVVLKPHTTTFRLVTDHSAGEHALNGFIAKSNVSICLDNLCDFGMTLRAVLARDR